MQFSHHYLSTLAKKHIRDGVKSILYLTAKSQRDYFHKKISGFEVLISFKPEKSRSFAGIRYIAKHELSGNDIKARMQIGLYHPAQPDFDLIFLEYPQFESDPHIGTIQCKNIDEYIRVLVAHEICHVIQFIVVHGDGDDHWNGIQRKSMKAGHGTGWKKMYKLLRAEMLKGY